LPEGEEWRDRCAVLVQHGDRKKIGGSDSSYRERFGRRLRGAGEEISYNVVGAREVKESGRKLGQELKVPLLPGGKGCASFGNSRHQGFMVRKKGERTTFEEKTEMANREESS
jgi:hypothetical protein